MADGYTPTIEDFDSFTEEDYERALLGVKDAFRVKTMIKGSTFYCLMPSGGCYAVPLGISVRQFEKLSQLDDSDAISYFRGIVGAFAPGKADKLADEPLQSVLAMLEAFAQAVSEVQGASLGE